MLRSLRKPRDRSALCRVRGNSSERAHLQIRKCFASHQSHSSSPPKTDKRIFMGKNKSRSLNEDSLVLPPYPSGSRVPIVDTHTHLVSTFSAYRAKFKDSAKYASVYDFVCGIYASSPVESIIDVWCEAPVQKAWREIADSAVTEEGRAQMWGGIGYWFVMGVHPHESKDYTDEVEQDILEAMAHPRCVGWGEIGLDYHYDRSPREKQQEIFIRQLRLAVAMQKPVTVHTREAEEDTERILKAEAQ